MSSKVSIPGSRAEMFFVRISAGFHILRKVIWLLQKATVLLALGRIRPQSSSTFFCETKGCKGGQKLNALIPFPNIWERTASWNCI